MHEADGKCLISNAPPSPPPTVKDIRPLSLRLGWEYWQNYRRMEIPKYHSVLA
jgi:hypothetical protein